MFIVGHLGGFGRRKVFPIGEDGGFSNKEQQKPVQREIQADGQKGSKCNTDEKIPQNGKDRPVRIRRLTPTECERLQGFPDGWTERGIDKEGNEVVISDTQRYKVLGNAVTTNVMTAIGKSIQS